MTSSTKSQTGTKGLGTILVEPSAENRQPLNGYRVVNPPVYHASTYLFESYQDMRERGSSLDSTGRYPYGTFGNDTTRQLELKIAQLEGAEDGLVVGTGLAACTLPLITFARQGDHVLVPDSVYGPVRAFCTRQLSRWGIEAEFYDPIEPIETLAARIKPNTKLIHLESPGSVTFEVQDVAAIAALAKSRGVLTSIDNTWATPLHLQPLRLGVDIAVHAATKYLSGGSDLVMGLIASRQELIAAMSRCRGNIGISASPDDAYRVLRGLRSLAVRLEAHRNSALLVADHLAARHEVAEVLFPARPGDRFHDQWKAQFSGCGGLFSVIFYPSWSHERVAKFCDSLQVFQLGYSWGGYESLVAAQDPGRARTASPWPRPGMADGVLIRINVGLEDVQDLLDDLSQAFERANK